MTWAQSANDENLTLNCGECGRVVNKTWRSQQFSGPIVPGDRRNDIIWRGGSLCAAVDPTGGGAVWG